MFSPSQPDVRLTMCDSDNRSTALLMRGFNLSGFQEFQLPAVTDYCSGQSVRLGEHAGRMVNRGNTSRVSLQHAGLHYRLMFLAALILLLLSLLHIAVAADSDSVSKVRSALLSRNIQFTTLSVTDGLSQAAVNSIVQDREGYIWFATQEGLNRYNGYEIVVYQHDSTNPRSLSHDWVWTLFVDHAGHLWVGTDGGGLSRYESDTDDFTHFRHHPDDPSSLSNNRVRVIYEDRKGRLWIGTDGGGLNLFNPEQGGFIHYRHDADNPHSLTNDKVLTVLEDRSGVFWVGTDGGGLSRFNRESEQFFHYRHDPARPDSLSDDRVRILYEEKNGRFWIGTYAGGVNLFNPVDESFKQYRHDPSDPFSLSHDEVRDIYQDVEGTVWFATDAGLNEWRPDIQGFIRYTHDSSDSSSIASDRVIALYQGRGGVLWIGTYAGVSRWNYVSDAFTYFQSRINGASGLSSNLITGISESPDGAVWVGTYGGGLNRLDPLTGNVTTYQHDPLDVSSLSDDRVMSVFADRAGNIWVGTRVKGLNRLDTKTGRFTHFRHNPEDKSSLSADSVSSIYGGDDGTLWVGTYGGGLNRLDLASGKFSVFRHVPDDPATLSSDRVLNIYRDRSGTLWFGTEDGGINRFNEMNETFTHYRHDPKDARSLGSDTAWDMLESRDGTFWIATRDGGLNRWLAKDRREGRPVFTRYGKKEGLISNTLHGVLEDEDGIIWLSSNRGLSRLEPATGTLRHFDKMNGLQGDEFNFGARYLSSSGALLFGGTEGLVMFHPDNIRSNPHRPPVVLTAYSHMTPVAKSHSANPEPALLVLDYRDYSISFEFNALDFTSADKNQYRYTLEGFDNTWFDSGRYRRASYTNLPPGRYVFKVKASNNDGVWSDGSAAISVQVTPPPWKTIWAYLGYVAILCSLVFLLIRYQLNKLKLADEQRKELEKQVQLRTKELAEQNHALEDLTQQLEKASLTDPLTGLSNRRYLHQYIESEIAAVARTMEDQHRSDMSALDIAPSLSFMMIDLDGFKLINDTYGHHAGDLALVQVRDILLKCCRKSDTIVRWGGDEFFIVGRHANRLGAEKYAERIRSALVNHQYQVGGGHVVRLSGSIGVTLFPFAPHKAQQLTWEQVVTIADQAAYLAKQNGRNAWVGLYGTRRISSDEIYERLTTDLERLVSQGMVEMTTSIEEPLVFANRTKQKNA